MSRVRPRVEADVRMTGFEYNNVDSECIGDKWKETPSDPGSEWEMPIRHVEVQAAAYANADGTLELRTSDDATITSNNAVNLGDWV